MAAILSFYDELRRRGRTVDSLDRIVGEKLAAGREADRGAERLFRQTQFLAATFAAFERRVADSGRIDEHAPARAAAVVGASGRYRHIVVTVADQAAGPRGLWPADFDLLARLPGVERVDVVATEGVLAAGWHERLHDALPEIEETRLPAASVPPVLLAPAADAGAEPAAVFVLRDREEELADAARWIKRRGREGAERRSAAARTHRHRVPAAAAVPLPGAAGARLRECPLSGIRRAAARRRAVRRGTRSGVRGGGGRRVARSADRAACVAALDAAPDGALSEPPSRAAIAALDRLLQELRFLGGWEQLASLDAALSHASARLRHGRRRCGDARRAACAPRWQLRPVFERIAGARQCVGPDRRPCSSSSRRANVSTPAETGSGERQMRARAAIVGALVALRDAHARYDDRPLAAAELWATVRRWIEGQTFAPRTGSGGVRLLDAAAAPYAQLDAMRLVGLVESDWPERSNPSIFYPAGLLRELGWPADADRLAAARARFDDLLQLPAREVSASAFTLEDDAIVPPSPFVDNVARAGLEVHRPEAPPFVRIFDHEALSLAPVASRRRCRRRRPHRLSGSAGACRGRRARMRAITAPSGRAPRASTRSATSSAISNARSSTSPRRCFASRRSGRTNPG